MGESKFSALVCWLLVMTVATTTEAVFFYSINERSTDTITGFNDELVTIDSTTGEVNVVGSLGIDAIFPTLTMVGDRLFGRTSVERDGDTLLIEIDRDTGNVISSVPVTVGGTRPEFAEALATLDDELVISYKRDGANNTYSNTVGTLALDGTISNPRNFPLSIDIDAITFDASGQGFAFDQFRPGDSTTQFMQIDLASPSATVRNTIDSPQYWGISTSPSGDIFGIERTDGRRLTQFSAEGDATASVNYDDGFQLIGLAAIPPPGPVRLIRKLSVGEAQVAIAFDPATDHIFVKSTQNGVTREFTSTGEEVPPSFIMPTFSDDAAGLDFLPEPINIGGTVVPAGALLFFDGDEETEVAREEIAFAVDKNDGRVLGQVPIGFGNPPAGMPRTNGTQSGAYHPGRDTFYILNWDHNLVRELDPATGELLNEFSTLPHIGIFWGGIDVSQVNGHVFVVSSDSHDIVELTAEGEFVDRISLRDFDVGRMTSIALDDKTGDAWITNLRGEVFRFGGVALAIPEPPTALLATIGLVALALGQQVTLRVRG